MFSWEADSRETHTMEIWHEVNRIRKEERIIRIP